MNGTNVWDENLATLKGRFPPSRLSKRMSRDPYPTMEVIKEQLGTALPNDYLQFTQLYGTGEFGVPKYSDIVQVISPQDRRYHKTVFSLIDIYSEHRENEGVEFIPYPLHPKRPGLLPWGWGSNRRAYFWHTKGRPSQWHVIFLTPEDRFVATDLCFTSFLIAVLDGKIDLGGSFSRKWIATNKKDFHFTPR